MPAQQHAAEARNPNALDLTRVASYTRTIRADIERVWENVLDWEHLAHLHDHAFDYIDVIDAGDWGWRVHSRADRAATIELVVADEGSYVSRTYADGAQQAEIWTFLTPGDGTTDIRVEFDLAAVPRDRVQRYGQRMLELYERLWDEDEGMMMERARRLREQRDREGVVMLGESDGVCLPLTFQLAGREYRLAERDGALAALPTLCPHRLGPLPERPAADGSLTCPWHGYRFDVDTGACLWPETASCRLPPAPRITVEDGRIIARDGGDRARGIDGAQRGPAGSSCGP